MVEPLAVGFQVFVVDTASFGRLEYLQGNTTPLAPAHVHAQVLLLASEATDQPLVVPVDPSDRETDPIVELGHFVDIFHYRGVLYYFPARVFVVVLQGRSA